MDTLLGPLRTEEFTKSGPKPRKAEGSGKSKLQFSFSGHETFVFRYAWPKKAVDAVRLDPTVFQDDAAVVTLGVGKNMVRSMRHWGLVTGILSDVELARGQGVTVTPLGNLLFGDGGKDPYLEDQNTLWLLHWNLCRQEHRCTTWQWAFNSLPSNEFTRDSLYELINGLLRQQQSPLPSEGILRRDIEIFIRTYVASTASKNSVIEDSLDCPLVELQLVEDRGQSKHFQLRRGPKPSLDDYLFFYALLEFWQTVAPERDTLAVSDIAYRAGSPGSIFKLDEMSILERLERLDFLSKGTMSYGETAGVRQVYRRGRTAPLDVLVHYYDSQCIGE
jgi:hypothetical protein